MTVIYTSVQQRFNKIFFRGYKDGKRIQTNDASYQPTLYHSGSGQNDARSLYGESLISTTYRNIGEAKAHVKQFKEIKQIFGNDRFEYDFIHRNFKGEIAAGLPDLSVIFVDIETTVEFGFPDVKNPMEEVLLISCFDMKSKQMTTFGCRPYSGSDTNYVLCADEKDLLQKWINYCIDVDFDIMTGWNVIAFDMAYLGSRIIKILGQKALNRLSPFGIVDMKTETIMDREIIRYEIAGRVVLDMLELYRKFRFINRPSYKLSYIGDVEIGETKTENPYKTFKEHYTLGWNDSEGKEDGFVRYNIQDVNLLVKLEDKLGLIYLAAVLAYLTKINFSDVYSPVKMWESYILSTLMEKNVFCELKSISSSDHTIVGGFVKEPVPGLYKWPVSFDMNSMYPSIMVALNMSPETIVAVELSNIQKLENFQKIDDEYTHALNGSNYRKDITGVLASTIKHVMSSRKDAKNKMLEYKKQKELIATKMHESSTADLESEYKHAEGEAARMHVLQLALKTLGNSAYGACASKYFIFFDNRIAEGVTMTGQFIIKNTGKVLSDTIAKITKVDKDYNIYNDTDSSYVALGDIVETYYSGKSNTEIAGALDKFITAKLDPVLDKLMDTLGDLLNVKENTFKFKREAIASSSFWCGKKRYAMNVIDNEGVRYSEPDIKLVGLETQRSSTPDLVRSWLFDAIKLILDHSDRNLLVDYIEKRRSEFKTYKVEDIAFPRSANNLTKYADTHNIYTGGTPIAVRAALLYNMLVHKYGLEKDLDIIREGNKIKYVALKEPNTLKENIIGFPETLPVEFGLHRYVDYDVQFEKAFLDPLEKIMNAMGWKLTEGSDLDEFF